jgi:hypothetical protein
MKASGVFVVLAMLGAMTTGCAIHNQAPIKEVAYDFSDRDFYDRSYAPSPVYGDVAPQTSGHAKAKDVDEGGNQTVVVIVNSGGKVTVEGPKRAETVTR